MIVSRFLLGGERGTDGVGYVVVEVCHQISLSVWYLSSDNSCRFATSLPVNDATGKDVPRPLQ